MTATLDGLEQLQQMVSELADSDPRTTWRTYAHLQLGDWIGTVRARGYAIVVEDGRAMISQGHPTIRDYWMLVRHNHALAVAVGRTHPDWWAYASGASDRPPAPNQIPATHDPTSADGLAFACATCGGISTGIDDQALAWCEEHTP